VESKRRAEVKISFSHFSRPRKGSNDRCRTRRVSHTTGVVHDRCPTRQDVQGETKQVSTATGMKPAAHARVTRRFSTRGDANERRVHRRRGWSPIPGGRAGGRGRTRTSAGSSRAQRRSATQPAGRKKGRGGGERVRVCEGTRGREGTQRARRGRCYFLFRFFLEGGVISFSGFSWPVAGAGRGWWSSFT
jgi:hypothetical protein